MKFRPLLQLRTSLTCSNIYFPAGNVKNADHFCYGEETKLAWEAGKLTADITEEQRKLTEADLVIFQFPMYWFTVPAIMKGWMDRVLTLGFAFTHEKRYSQGIFKDKKAMLSFTTGSQESMFTANGINGDMNVTLWPLQLFQRKLFIVCINTLFFSPEWHPALLWLQVLAPQIFWAPSHVPSEARGTMLESWRTHARPPGENPLAFTPLDCFDGEKGYQLKPEVHENMLPRMSEKVLIVYAHQSSGSFNSAAKDAALEVLTAKGCTVEVSDLYAMKFKATATAEDHW
ncbi:hypothetical protein F7725_002023 [Dissostichus mawsoni]|uniref:Flavodoxin-like fold domain-containing protein n=1 Tax=Dissostichus mawsoni TaxID=36200 RepID=A0A7J5Y178_DISMA|nr:hypothetical protein F7725_002023 [Dissostichus mawsoni]